MSTDLQTSAGALAGIRVIDISRVLAGPYCGQLLADHGAEVIKIEPPAGDGTREWGQTYPNGISAYYAGLNRNKRHTSVDLAGDRGRDILLSLLKGADVLIESFKPGTMEKWGMAPTDLLEQFPRLVICRITAFGADGPMGGLPGYDAVIQAYSGIMDLNGEFGRGPVRVPMPLTDITTGMLAFSGVLLALVERHTSGLGQIVDLSLLDAAVSLHHPAAANFFLTGDRPERIGTAHPNIAPCDTFESPEGHLYVAAGNDRQFVELCSFLGSPETSEDPRFVTNADRLAHKQELTEVLTRLVAQQQFDEDSARRMIERGIPASLVRHLDSVLADPQLAHRDMIEEVEGLQVLGIPIKLSRTPGSIRTAPAVRGAHSRQTLSDLGVEPDVIDQLVDAGIVYQATVEETRPGFTP